MNCTTFALLQPSPTNTPHQYLTFIFSSSYIQKSRATPPARARSEGSTSHHSLDHDSWPLQLQVRVLFALSIVVETPIRSYIHHQFSSASSTSANAHSPPRPRYIYIHIQALICTPTFRSNFDPKKLSHDSGTNYSLLLHIVKFWFFQKLILTLSLSLQTVLKFFRFLVVAAPAIPVMQPAVVAPVGQCPGKLHISIRL